MQSLFTDEHDCFALFRLLLRVFLNVSGKNCLNGSVEKTSQEADGSLDVDYVAEGFWSELPPEILDLIASRLGIIELLGFRSTCNSWRSASVNASAEIERKPWFLLYDDGSKCSLINKLQLKRYSREITELEGANCIASNGGWLLVYRDGSVFFFCLFSGARIDLPPLPDSSFSDHVGAISSSPTSQDCIVCVIHNQGRKKLVLNLIRRGATEWSKHVYLDKHRFLSHIVCASYCDGIWYFLDSVDALVTFSLDKAEWVPYVVHYTTSSAPVQMPFSAARFFFQRNNMKEILGLGEPYSISICGTKFMTDDDRNCHIFNENITGNENEPDTLHLKGVWIIPRFIQLPPSYSW